MSARDVGRRGEDMAAAYLEGIGAQIVERNYTIRGGEIDVIFRDGETLVFCEVKARSGSSYGLPREAVDERKIKTLSRCAAAYVHKHGVYEELMRFDVIEVYLDSGRIEHYKDAFYYTQ